MALFTIEQLERAESYLADEKYDTILPAFEGMVADMEVYIDEMCPTSDEVQWFSFASPFERLTYQRVESDPRELRDVPVPFDRAYADLAFCQINLERFDEAAANLKQAVRWNPMKLLAPPQPRGRPAPHRRLRGVPAPVLLGVRAGLALLAPGARLRQLRPTTS